MIHPSLHPSIPPHSTSYISPQPHPIQPSHPTIPLHLAHPIRPIKTFLPPIPLPLPAPILPNPTPLPIIRNRIDLIRRNARRLILHLLLQDQVQENGHEPRDREARLEHEHDGVEEALLRLVPAAVGEDVGEPVGNEDGAEAEGERRRQDEPVAPGEGDGGDDSDARDGDGGEEEGGQAAEDGVRDRDERRGEFGEYPHEAEEEAGGVAGFAVRAPGQRDDAVVLREGAHGRDGAEARDEAVEPVG